MCPAELPTVAQVRLARPATDGELDVVPTDVVYSLEMNSINAVILPKEIMFANTTKVNHCHCEEFDDVAIGIQVRMTYRAGQHCPCRGLRCPYRAFEDCHVVELLAMTNGRALLPLASLQTVNNVRRQYI